MKNLKTDTILFESLKARDSYLFKGFFKGINVGTGRDTLPAFAVNTILFFPFKEGTSPYLPMNKGTQGWLFLQTQVGFTIKTRIPL